MKDMTLRAIGDEFGISRRAIQGYEAHGLVHPTGKNERGHLTYDESTVKQIVQVRRYSQLGFPVREIGKLLCMRPEELKPILLRKKQELLAQMREMKTYVELIEQMINVLETKIPDKGEGYEEDFQSK